MKDTKTYQGADGLIPAHTEIRSGGIAGDAAGLATVNTALLNQFSRAHDAILVDIGGVLYYDDPIELFYTYRMHYHLKAAGLHQIPGPVDLLHLSRGTSSLPVNVRKTQWETMNSLAWAETLSCWKQIAMPIPGAIPKLAAFRPARVAIVANQPREMIEVLAREGVMRYCDVLALDSLCGSSKPNSEIFLFALRALSVEPCRALMIGDRIDNDITPAARLGLRTLWIRRRLWTGTLRGLQVPAAWRRRFMLEISRDKSLLKGSGRACAQGQNLFANSARIGLHA